MGKKYVSIEEFYAPAGIGQLRREILIVMSNRTGVESLISTGKKCLFREGIYWTAIDNSDGEYYVESFLSRNQAIRYLRGNEVGEFYRRPVFALRRIVGESGSKA